MPNYNRFHINCYLKATCNIILFDQEGFTGQEDYYHIEFSVFIESKALILKTKINNYDQ